MNSEKNICMIIRQYIRINGEINRKIIDSKYTNYLKNIISIFKRGSFYYMDMCFLFLIMKGAFMYF